ncbi:NRPS-like enzyme [Mycena floridula]|nr:NRPS-like enzyme [Mycena floridula]
MALSLSLKCSIFAQNIVQATQFFDIKALWTTVYTDIPWKAASRALHKAGRLASAATWRTPACHRNPRCINSMTYIALIAGIMRAGSVPFPLSPRNPPAAIAHLLRTSGCKSWFVSSEPSTLELASFDFDELFEKEGADWTPLPVLKAVDPQGPCLILHSSGTTLLPKVVIWTHKMMREYGTFLTNGDVEPCGQVLSAHGLPIYHIMGAGLISWMVMSGLILSFYSPREGVAAMLNPDNALSNITDTKCTLAFCVPTFLESWASDPKGVQVLKSLKSIVFGGGPLKPDVGDMLLHEKVNISSSYGMTETGGMTLTFPSQPPKEGWEWMQFSPHVQPAFIPIEDDRDMFRLVIKQNPSHTLAVCNHLIDGVGALDTNDLVIRHPQNEALFKIFRSFCTGEKTNPIPIETMLVEDPSVDSALMFGRQQFQPGVIITPSPEEVFDPADKQRLEEYRNKIWKTVADTNEISPRHSRIFREMILVAHPNKPFEYTAKGTLRRAAILSAYEAEISNAYKPVDEASQIDNTMAIGSSLESVTSFIRGLLHKLVKPGAQDTDNIFELGADSLTAISIQNSILLALKKSRIPNAAIRALPSNFVYRFPSIHALSDLLHVTISVDSPASSSPAETQDDDDEKEEVFDWSDASLASTTVVKLRKGKGEIPLIALPGGGGFILHFKTFPETFRTAEERPRGPYRLAAYSSSSLLLLILAKLFEDNGDEIVQLAMMDHFPTAFFTALPENIRFDASDPTCRADFIRLSGRSMLRLLPPDSGLDISEFQAVFDGRPTSALYVHTLYASIAPSFGLVFDFIAQFSDEEQLVQWMRQVKTQLIVYFASEGVCTVIREMSGEVNEDLGARRCFPNVKIIPFEAGHFDLLEKEEFVSSIQHDF